MTRFLVSRLLQSVVVLILISFFIYGMIGLMPGDPVDLMISANPEFDSEDAARLRAIYGLDQPLWSRYLNWAAAALQGDFGYSRGFNQPAIDILIPRMMNTIVLMLLAMAIALAIALPVGIHAARHPSSPSDTVINFLCFAGISIPPFWLALMLIMLFSVTLGWLPASGMGRAGSPILDQMAYLVMPVITLTAASVAGYTRYVRASMREVLRYDYIRTARAKGVGETRVVWGHGLRNGMIPVVTVIALDFGTLFSGALITETMFGYLGMGKTIYDAIMGNDYNLALIGLLFATVMVIVANLLADTVYTILDPRISYDEGRR